ncbi:DUF1499 domain-containing protein [Actimicrobium antarcticum]|uniref:DUF1499 domain-containing protein n=1 Tax=Actimicrobium antarcticum TaxID=1051899 RepID=A0ABP7TTR7_9BURK
MAKILGILALVLFLAIPAGLLLAGQAGLLKGHRPTDLGLHDGLLKPPVQESWNVVSSHARLQPHTDYHVIAPISYNGDGKAALVKLTGIVRNMDGVTVVTSEPTYLYAEFQTRLLKFVDDVEFVLDEPAGVIQMRSASRLGRKDFDANRNRLEAIRARFNG